MSNLTKRNGPPMISPNRDPAPGNLPVQSPHRSMAGPADRDEISLPNLWSFLCQLAVRRKWMILAVCLVVTGTAAVQLFTMRQLYRAEATVQINPDGALALPYKEVSEATEDFRATESYVQTQKELLEGRTLARRVAKRLDLASNENFDLPGGGGILIESIASLKNGVKSLILEGEDETVPEPGEREAGLLLQNIQITLVPGTRLVDIKYDSHDPDLATQIVNTYTEEFVQMEAQYRQEVASTARNLIQERLSALKRNIEKSQADLIRYARQEQILTVDEDQSIALQSIADLSEEMVRVQNDLIEKRALRDALVSFGGQELPAVLRTERLGDLETELHDLQQQMASLSAQFGKKWPERVRVEREITKIGDQISQERQKILVEVETAYARSLAQFQMLEKELNSVQLQANREHEDLIQYSVRKQEIETSQDLYSALWQRLKEMSVAEGSDLGRIRVIEPAVTPEDPNWPSRGHYLAVALFAGLLFGFGSAALLETLDSTLKSGEEVEELLGLPCLGVIPKFNQENYMRSLKALNTGGPAELPESVTFSAADAPSWEAYRSLRTSLLLSSSGSPPRTVMVTSADPSEGKTLTAVNTAIALAQTGIRTLIVDLDLRRPCVSGIFGDQSGKGISLYLSGHSNLHSQIRPTGIPNLFLLPAGLRPPNPAELMSSERMQAAFKVLSEHFGFVVVDSAPLMPFTDSVVLSQKVDGVVMVARAEQTPQETVRRGAAMLANVGARMLGVVINGKETTKGDYSRYSSYYQAGPLQASSF